MRRLNATECTFNMRNIVLQVRDQLTSTHEQESIDRGRQKKGSLQRDALRVDAIVSTIGFPLVGEGLFL